MEGRGTGRGPARRVTMAEAAEELGVTVEAIRKRVQRGSILSDKGPDGRRYVYLDESHREVQDEGSTLADELRDRIRYLERQVEEEREARRRADLILGQLSQANAEQARTIRALEAPREASEEDPEDAESVEESPEEAEPRLGTPGPQTSTGSPQARPWWRRVFGG